MSYTPLEEKLRTALLAFSGITGLVGSNVFADQLPQGLLSPSLPGVALTLKRVSTQFYTTLDTNINALAAPRIQFTGWSNRTSSKLDVLNINYQLALFLNQFSATGYSTQTPNTILNAFVSLYPQSQPPLYMGVVDARIFNREDL